MTATTDELERLLAAIADARSDECSGPVCEHGKAWERRQRYLDSISEGNWRSGHPDEGIALSMRRSGLLLADEAVASSLAKADLILAVLAAPTSADIAQVAPTFPSDKL